MNDFTIFCVPYKMSSGPGLMDGKYDWFIPVIYLASLKGEERLLDARIYRASRAEAHSLALYLGKVYRYACKRGKILL